MALSELCGLARCVLKEARAIQIVIKRQTYGTFPGDIAIFDAQTLLPLNKLQQGHMVFCTAVSFSSREEGLLSVSGDASMRTIPLLAARSMQLFVILFSLVVLLVALILGYVLAHRR